MEEEFYSTIKLVSGEEIFSKISVSEEENRTLLILLHPIVISEIRTRTGSYAYKVEPWIKTTTEDMFIINLNTVITMTESSDIEMISMYQAYMRKKTNQFTSHSSYAKIDESMGYLGNVNDTKELLEKIFNTN